MTAPVAYKTLQDTPSVGTATRGFYRDPETPFHSPTNYVAMARTQPYAGPIGGLFTADDIDDYLNDLL